MNYQSVKFNLFTPPLVTSTADPFYYYGVKNNTRTIYEYNNINLKRILGVLYYKYDYFNLNLTAIYCNTSAPNITNADDTFVNIEVSNLFFENCYDSSSKYNKTNTSLGLFKINTPTNTTSATSLKFFDGTHCVVIKKTPDNTVLKISLNRSYNDITLGSTLPNIYFFFEISGIE
jgi:hypothetical protein